MIREIASQPACWLSAARTARAEAVKLPLPGEDVAVVGCGSAWHMGVAYAALRESAGHGPTDAFAVSEMPVHREYDRLVVISGAGATREVTELLGKLWRRMPVTVITGPGARGAAEIADEVVALGFAEERSPVETRFATSALALLRATLGHDLRHAVRDAQTVLRADLGALPHMEQFSFLGSGWTLGLAHVAALTLREAAGVWTEARPAMEYRHGPTGLTRQGRVVWMFGEAPDGVAEGAGRAGVRFLDSGTLDPMAHLVLAQRVAAVKAQAQDLDPDAPAA